jgi:xylulokinase
MIVPRPGWAEHRAEEDWWGDFVFIARRLIADSGIDPAEIRAVATSAIGPCMLPVDNDGVPLINGVLYGVDTRAELEIDELNAEIGADLILERCGNALTSQSVGPKILWFKRNHPELLGEDRQDPDLDQLSDHRLTGEYVIDHYTAANFSPLYDIGTQDWCFDLADFCPPDRLPRLMWSTEIAGHVSEAAARETGLAAGTPVTCGTIDAAAEAVSVGVGPRRHDDDVWLDHLHHPVIGQTLVGPAAVARALAVSRRTRRDGGACHIGHANPLVPRPVRARVDTRWAFGELAREAEASPPGAKGLICLPYFSGERTPIHDARAKGTFFGLDLTHDRGDMYRAVLEGIASATGTLPTPMQRPGKARARAGGGRRHEEPALAAGDIGPHRARPDRLREDHGRVLRRRLPGGPCGGRGEARRYSPMEPGSGNSHAEPRRL